MPVVTAAKSGCQFPWWRNIGVAVQNVTDFIRIFLMDALQRQLCEPLRSMSIKSFAGGICGRGFVKSSVFSRNAEEGGPHKCANKYHQT